MRRRLPGLRARLCLCVVNAFRISKVQLQMANYFLLGGGGEKEEKGNTGSELTFQ